MQDVLPFLAFAAVAVASPGPGVLMTLTNALRHGRAGTLGGIFGIASGTFVVAALSATGVGWLLATSATAFTVMKWLGATYLAWLAFRLWRAPLPALPVDADAGDAEAAPEPLPGDGPQRERPADLRRELHRHFAAGFVLQLSNPKAIAFFLSVFPQFLTPGADTLRFASLVLLYSGLVVVIHGLYALGARRARRWLTSPRGARWLNRVAALVFLGFAGALARSQR
jgi:homoserine/homoserine lactone efflux protein